MFTFWKIWLSKDSTKQNPSQKKAEKNAAHFERLPKTLKELDPSYGMMIRELGKR